MQDGERSRVPSKTMPLGYRFEFTIANFSFN
nr:MAG TPA_asm: hypothetical protein [Caudoviricetes sp.]